MTIPVWPDPINHFETIFGIHVVPGHQEGWRNLKSDDWLEFFCSYYKKSRNFFDESKQITDDRFHLYFDFYQGEEFRRLNHSEDPFFTQRSPQNGLFDTRNKNSVEGVSQFLLKQLLIADCIIIPDNFLSRFDFLAEAMINHGSRGQLAESDVKLCISGVIRWLDILSYFRKFFKEGSIKFIPYYALPGFPFADGGEMGKIWRSKVAAFPPKEAFHLKIDERIAFASLMRSYSIGGEPVFPSKTHYEFAKSVSYLNENRSLDNITPDFFDIPLFRDREYFTISDVTRFREGGEASVTARRVLREAREYVEKFAVDERTARHLFKGFIEDELLSGRCSSECCFPAARRPPYKTGEPIRSLLDWDGLKRSDLNTIAHSLFHITSSRRLYKSSSVPLFQIT